MINTTKVISTSFDSVKRLLVKVLRLGSKDVREIKQVSPYGIDSNPVKDMVAIFAATPETGKDYIVGYINKNCIANPGEVRMFSTDDSGTLKAYSYHKNDGTIEFCGSANTLVKHAPLDSSLQTMVSLINAELLKIQAAYPLYIPTPVTLNISASNASKLKTE